MSDELEARTIGELSRQFSRFQDDIREDLKEIRRAADQAVRRDVYDAEQRLLLARIVAIEADRDKQQARADRAIQLAVGGLALPIIVAVIAAIVAWALSRGGA